MPLVRIDIPKGKPESYRTTVGESIYDAMVSTLNVPANDKFQVITEHDRSGLVADPTYLGIARSADCIIIQVTLNAGRTVEMKKAFYAAVAVNLHERNGIRKEDIVISLVEVAKENWSFGLGVAQYA